MKSYKIKKLYLGKYASVRSYVVEEHKRKNQPLIINYNGLTMTILAEKLSSFIQLNHQVFESKFGKGLYRLYDYRFQPDIRIKK